MASSSWFRCSPGRRSLRRLPERGAQGVELGAQRGHFTLEALEALVVDGGRRRRRGRRGRFGRVRLGRVRGGRLLGVGAQELSVALLLLTRAARELGDELAAGQRVER